MKASVVILIILTMTMAINEENEILSQWNEG
jgi:hypothetical protein